MLMRPPVDDDEELASYQRSDDQRPLLHHPHAQRAPSSSFHSSHSDSSSSGPILLTRTQFRCLLGYATLVTCVLLAYLWGGTDTTNTHRTTIATLTSTHLEQQPPELISSNYTTNPDPPSDGVIVVAPTPSSSLPPSIPSDAPRDVSPPLGWFGPLSYTSTPYLPPHHLNPRLARFMHLTDLHLEYAYDPTESSRDPIWPGVCRRQKNEATKESEKDKKHNQQSMDYDWLQDAAASSDRSATTSDKVFPLGRESCDTPLKLYDSSLELTEILASRVDGYNSAALEVNRSDPKLSTSTLDQSDSLGGVLPPLTDSDVPVPSPSSSASPPPLDFVLATGDFVAHFVGSPVAHRDTHDEAIRRLVKKVRPFVRNGRIFPAIGNVDLFPTGYIEDTKERIPLRLTPISNSDADVSDTKQQQSKSSSSSHTIDCHPTFHQILTIYNRHGLVMSPSQQRTFCIGGYYSEAIPELGLRVVVLNSMPYAPDYLTDPKIASIIKKYDPSKDGDDILDSFISFRSPKCPQHDDDPFDQLKWFKKEFHEIVKNNEKLLIASHYPPGHKDKPNEFSWCPTYVKRFREILSPHPSVILAGMFGDFSEDVVRFLYANDTSLSSVDGTSSSASSSPSSSLPSSMVTSIDSTPQLPLLSMFVSPGLSPRKRSNPTARVWYLKEENEQDEQLNQLSKQMQDRATLNDESTNQSNGAQQSNSSFSSPLSNPRRLALHDYSQWYLPLPYANDAVMLNRSFSWQYHYSFRSCYQMASMRPQQLAYFTHQLATNPLIMFQYQLHTTANMLSKGPTSIEWLCDMKFVEPEANNRCKQRGEGL